MSRLGQQIAILRTAKGMTRKQLGKAIGVDEKFIENVELGKRALNDDLLRKLSKVLEQEISSVMIYETDENSDSKDVKAYRSEIKRGTVSKIPKKNEEPEINDMWGEAFGSVLKEVPVYGYDLTTVIEKRHMAVLSNKIAGYSKDKVFFLEIDDDDMAGFRIRKGDIAFGYLTHELENNAVCLIEYKGQRVVRQLKRLEGNRILIVSNGRSLATETAEAKEIRILARLVKLEILL